MSDDGLAGKMLEWVRRHGDLDAAQADRLGADTDLIAHAVLDSIAFLELIAFTEQQTGRRIDLMMIDPADLTSIRGLCRHVASLARDGS